MIEVKVTYDVVTVLGLLEGISFANGEELDVTEEDVATLGSAIMSYVQAARTLQLTLMMSPAMNFERICEAIQMKVRRSWYHLKWRS